MMLHRHFEALKAKKHPIAEMETKEGEDMLMGNEPEQQKSEPTEEHVKRSRRRRADG